MEIPSLTTMITINIFEKTIRFDVTGIIYGGISMKKNVALLVGKLTGGGAEKIAANLSLQLSVKYNIYIFVYNETKNTYSHKGKVIKVESNTSKNIFGKAYYLYKRVNNLKKLKKKFKIDITISFLDHANFLNIFSRYNDKVLISEHNYINADKGNLSKRGAFFRFFYNRADEIVVVSKGIKNNLINNFNINPTKITNIYNSFEIKKINRLSQKTIENKYNDIFNNPCIINVGSLSKQKGQWFLIRIFKLVKEEILDVKLVILGQGSMEEYLKNLTNKLNLEDDVYFLGFKDNPYKYIRNSDVFAFTSLFEGFGNVLIESMASGTPVISTDCKHGPREIMTNEILEKKLKDVEYTKYGVLTPVFSNKILNYDDQFTEQEIKYSKALIKILKDENLRKDFINNQQNIMNKFDLTKISKKWEELIEFNL
ncbi:glycosyltransferase [Halanaerobium hydrogeniformans]|uniref:Glycosyl transferase group 1 n=1 Tax=Halanaerobium hydrogeniformans TaxID=656519 RepID=E4RNK9_HALHG|nr:glycosyltransferase [Halanaerobium hydrogeniformans]ADQ13544.1 glycosyl transferase group 1 [Halanaerobium hydrogeniformans]